MFGRGMIQSPHLTPQWIADMGRILAPNRRIQWAWFPIRASKPGDNRRTSYGACYPKSAMIEIHCNAIKDDAGLMVVIHEIAHILSPHKSQCPYTKRIGHHGRDFWRTLAPLYARFGLYDYAIAHEAYAIGKRYLSAHRGEHIANVRNCDVIAIETVSA